MNTLWQDLRFGFRQLLSKPGFALIAVLSLALGIEAQAGTANFFPLLGVKPMLGRVFTQEEDKPGTNRVAIVSYGLWQRRFGGDQAVVGKEITLDGQKHTILGV